MYQIILCAADHGVAEENVSAFPASITKTMVRNYLHYKGAALNAFASLINAPVIVADLGMREKYNHTDLVNLSVRKGTHNIAKGAAMTKEEAALAIDNGRKLAKTAINNGAKYILPAEMGIANTTSSAAMSAALLNLPAEKVTGRGTNISNEKLTHKINIVKKAVEINNCNNADALDILTKLGGFELAAITGITLEAAKHNVKVILDGLNTSVAALIAARMNTNAKKILLPSHLAGEAAHKYLLKELELTPVMDLDFHLGEACGSSILAKCIELQKSGEDLQINNSCAAPRAENISEKQKKLAKEIMKKRFMEFSMPHHALGAIEEIAVTLAEMLGEANIKEDIKINKNWLNSIGVNGEKYLINEKKIPYLTEALVKATLCVINRMKTFDEAVIL